jgi:uncharacterized protein YecE (DUF72 family)
VFAVKGSRFITHMKRLNDIEKPLANFFASGVFELKEKLGPFLWQFPPNFRFDADKLAAFFEQLPRDTEEALSLARRRDERVKGRCRLSIDACRPLRHAIEIRHESFRDPAFVKLLRKHRVALVVADTAGKWPLVEDVTSGFMYVRLHGDTELYASGYTPAALDEWARRTRSWLAGSEVGDARKIEPTRPVTARRKGRDVYVYFDNDVKVHAPFDAKALAQRVEGRAFPKGFEERATRLSQLPAPPLRPWPRAVRAPRNSRQLQHGVARARGG